MDGEYPDEIELANITNWKVNSIHDYHELMQYVMSLWHWGDYAKQDGARYTLSTGGWSGNEEIIGALGDNTIFWLMYWKSSQRGGRYVFEPINLKD